MGRTHRLRLVLPRAPHAELLAGAAVEELGLRAGFPRDTLEEVKLAVVEACLNALEYGNGEVAVEIAAYDDRMEARVIDHGPGFDPQQVERPNLDAKLHATRKRGWGLELMRRLMDRVEVESQPGTTTVHMVRRRGGG